MSIKKTNDLLLISVIIGLIFDFFLGGLLFSGAGWDLASVVKYLVTFLIAVVMVKKSGDSVKDYLPYHIPMKFKTALYVFLLVLLAQPVTTTLSHYGGVVFGDDYAAIMDYIITSSREESFLEMMFTIAVIPAVFEEMFYRGFFYQGYRKGKGARTAILLTALLFGTFHMVAQQAVYAAALGIVLAVIRELTGSMWPGMWFHFLNNGLSVVEIRLTEAYPATEKFFIGSYLKFDTTASTIITIAAAIICIPLIILVLRKIAVVEGKEESFRNFFKEESIDSGEKLVTASLVISLSIQVLVMFGIKLFIQLMDATGLGLPGMTSE